MLERFRNGDRTPVGVGSHRRTEAIVIPVEVYDELTAQRETLADQAISSPVAYIIERWGAR